MPKDQREFVIEVKVVVRGGDNQELFEMLGATFENINDSLCQYGRVDDFKFYERPIGDGGGRG